MYALEVAPTRHEIAEENAMEFLRKGSWFGCKRAVQSRLRQIGIEVRKFPSVAFQPVSVFNLAVRLLMERQGAAVTFVQVGANDGVFGDPLRSYITTFPWRGILVEPQPDVFARLVRNYAPYADRLILENTAISSDRAELVLYKAPPDQRLDDVYTSSVASSDPGTIARQLGISEKQLVRIVTPSLTLDALLAKHGLKQMHILQIDVEGHDWQVLRTLDLERVRPSIIQFESGHLSIADCDSAVEHLTKNGYQIYWGGYQGDAVALSGAVFG
jgi:FkbM family methyltransferase